MGSNFNYINKQLEELKSYFSLISRNNSSISKVNVGWHVAHSLKVINGICYSLKTSDPQNYQPEFNFKKIIVFTVGAFPRGKAKAPKVVIPEGNIEIKDLQEQLVLARKNIQNFPTLEKNNFFDHPYFNHLNKADSKRLIEVHTRHHLKIIRDIIKGSPSPE